MKKKILALAITSVLSAGAQAAISDIIISEYLEGASDNKAIELTNTSAEAYAFTDDDAITYSSYNNTIYNPAKENILKGLVIAANETLVLVNANASQDLKDAVTANGSRIIEGHAYESGFYNSMVFNGDDHVALMTGDTVNDIIGAFKEKGNDWGKDKTFRRAIGAPGATPEQDAAYNPNNWKEALRDVAGTETSTDNFSDLGLPTFELVQGPGYEAPAGVVTLEILPEDNGSFAAALKRNLDKKVYIPADMNAAVEGEQQLIVTRAYGFNYSNYNNNMTAAYESPIFQPNNDFVAGSQESKDYAAANLDRALLIEDKNDSADGVISYFPDFNSDPNENYIRIGDSILGMVGTVKANGSGYKLVVEENVTSDNFFHNEPRTDKAGVDTTTVDGEFAITIATQNVLNLFNSPYGGPENARSENRGADSFVEYERQKAKLVEAIYGLDADIVGLMEIENNGFSDTGAIAEFVDAVNAKYFKVNPSASNDAESETNKYTFIGFDKNGDTVLDELDSIGSDVITSGLIYRSSKVSIESFKVIQMPEQHAPATVNDNNVVVKDSKGELLESGDNYQRNTIAGTFLINNTGKKLTVAVNHLKSKGSTCTEDWAGVEFGDSETWRDKAPDLDFQGQCENFRVAAAVQIGEELEKIGGDRVVIGDLNSYAKEYPMLVLTELPDGTTIKTARDTFIGKKPQFNLSGDPVTVTKAYGYISAVGLKDAERGHKSWSYSYNDEIGSLDHILITPSLNSRLIDAKDWHINAAESTYYDYNIVRLSSSSGLVPAKGDEATADKFYKADAFRSSDHDSAIMSLSYKYGEVSNGQPVHLVIDGGSVQVPFNLVLTAAKAKEVAMTTGTKAGDIAKITLSSDADMSEVVLPVVALANDGQSVVDIEVYGINAGTYNATLTLVRDGEVMPEFTKSMTFEAAKQDSTTAKVTPPAPYDGSGGGSFGIFGLLSLLGLGFLRRKA